MRSEILKVKNILTNLRFAILLNVFWYIGEMTIKCDFPFEISGKNIALDAIEAVSLQVPAAELPPKTPHHVAVYLSSAQVAVLQPIAEHAGLKLAVAVERLAYGLFQHRRRGKQQIDLGRGNETNRLRKFLLSEIKTGIDARQVVIAEASTGLGKSRVLGQAAEHVLTADKTSVLWVAAPTISVLLHLVAEFIKVNPALAPALLLGRPQFVSASRVREYFDDLSPQEDADLLAQRPQVEQWLSAGAEPTCNHTRKLAEIVPGVSHLMDDLLDLAPQINPVLVSMKDTDESEPAEEVIKEMNDAAKESRLVFCTQTMLIIRTRMIPNEDPLPFTHLFVDEVHDLESIAAAVESRELSLFALRAFLKKSKLAHRADAVAEITSLMKGLAEEPRLRTGFSRISEKTVAHIRSALMATALSLKRSKKDEKEEAERLHFLGTIKSIIAPRQDALGLSFSPVRRYPSVFCGPLSVGPTLARIWSRTKSAVGVSATIYLPTLGCGVSSGYMTSKLGVPNGRLRSVGPVTCSWVFSSPELWRPSDKAALAFCYPKAEEDAEDAAEDPKSFRQWADAVAAGIAKAAKSAGGGALVLCNSFKDISSLRERLALTLGDRLVAHERGLSVQAQKDRFVTIRRSGGRPVWLATGPAWTGLDLRDQDSDPEKDDLLTDVVIARVPFGLNRSSTHYRRKEVFRFTAELNEASIRLRQGIGRLVRSEGALNRRLWILDGRIYAQGHSHFRTLRSLLSGYEKQKVFDL